MSQFFSNLLDDASEFLAHRKGLLPLIGLVFIVANLVLQLFPSTWLAQSNCFLHVGIILAVVGFMLARAL